MSVSLVARAVGPGGTGAYARPAVEFVFIGVRAGCEGGALTLQGRKTIRPGHGHDIIEKLHRPGSVRTLRRAARVGVAVRGDARTHHSDSGQPAAANIQPRAERAS